MTKQSLTEKQKLMIAYGEAHAYSILAADPRLGKSRALIALARKRKANCLIICPAYLIPNWKKEINKWAPGASVTMFRKGKDIYDVCDSDFVVTSYDLVQKAEFLFEWADMVAADEIHNLKNMAAIRTQFFHRCLYENSIKYFYGLTGTPLKNRVKEFYSLIALTYYDPRMDDGYSPDFSKGWDASWKQNVAGLVEHKQRRKFLEIFPDEITFAEHFSYPETYEVEVNGHRITITNYKGLKNRAELKFWLKNRYIRIRADKNDLPPISYLDTLVSDIDDKKLLQSFSNYFRDDSTIKKMGRANGLTDRAVRKLRTSSVLPEHKRNAAVKKVPFTIKYVEDLLESKDCCLVYSDHRESTRLLAEHFGVPAITGEMPGSRRARLISDFQAGKIKMLCATIGSLKEGADLFRSKDVVLNDPPWVPGDILQVINRTRALGQKDPRTVHRIFGSPQDEIIWKILEEKMETIDKAT